MTRPLVVLLAVTVSCAITGCGSPPRPFVYGEMSDGSQKMTRVSLEGWELLFPGPWKVAENGTTGRASVIVLSREEPGERSGAVTPRCLVTLEEVQPDTAAKSYADDKFAKITGRLIRSGYRIEKVRDDALNVLTGPDTDGFTEGFAYELIAPAGGRGERVLAMTLFMKKTSAILSISFEMKPAKFNRLKKEIVSIIRVRR